MTERIKTLISYLGLSTRAFAINCGLRQNTLSNQLNGVRELSLSTVVAILTAYPQVSTDWLIAGEGEMIKKLGQESARVNGLVDAIATLQQTINAQAETISALNARIRELERGK